LTGIPTYTPALEYDVVNTSEWGEYGMQIGEWLFFGDPELLRHVEEALR
jgi:hypothetical protein